MASGSDDKRRKGRNRALAGLLAFLVVLFYALTIVKFGGQG
ncbi:MAG: hypothetical protein WD673_10410 [Alphaproteobacteria bacterium]